MPKNQIEAEIEYVLSAAIKKCGNLHDAEDLTQFFTEVSITEENGIPYLNALYKDKKTICERILKLDADRYQKGDLPLSNLLSKYCSYVVGSNKE